jgi:flagellar basal body-associated protein FliL
MRFSPRSRPSSVWLTIILGVFLILPALSLGPFRSASSFNTPQNRVSTQNNLPLGTSVTSQYAFTLNSQPSQNQPIGTSPLTYHGGPVEHEEFAYAIFWLPPGYHYEPSGSDSLFESLVARYFSDVGGSNLTQLLVQYPDDINGSPTSNVIFGGDFVDTSPYPHAGTVAAPLLGQDVTNEIEKVVTSGSLPQGINDAYFVFTANGINVCEDQAMTMCTFATAAQPAGFCAYHSYLQYGAVPPYAVLPVNPSGISGGCQIPSGITTVYPNSDSLADSEISLTAQQQINMQTDPYLSSWYDTSSPTGEISDKCAGVYGIVNATTGANVHINDHAYLIQEEWSNAIGGCTVIPPPTTSATVTLTPFGQSTPLNANNFFQLSYAIGKQLVVDQYVSGEITIHADPNTSLSISAMSSKSNVGVEKWCFNVICQGYVINLGTSGRNVVLMYYDLLEQNVYQVTSDSSVPSTFTAITYYTAPSAIGFGAPDVSTTINLAGYSQYIWIQRDSTATVSSQTYEKSNVERWANPAARWNVTGAFVIPYIVSYHQYLMSFNYSVVPATTSTLVGPNVTFTANGTTHIVVAPVKVWADEGSSYSFGNTIDSSTSTERWVPVGGSASGTVTGNATVNEVFYNQLLVKVTYNIIGTTGNVTSPIFTGTSFGDRLNVPLNTTVKSLWLDSGSSYLVPSLLPGSNSTDQWISTKNVTGTIGAMTTALNFTYYHQYALNFSYTIIGGGSPQSLPIVNYSSTSGTLSIRLSSTPSPVWVNAGSALNVSSIMAASNSSERWAYNSGSELASAPGTFEITLYHQYHDGFSTEVLGGGTPGTQPYVKGFSFGQPVQMATSNTTTFVWLDAGSYYGLPNSLGSTSSERWVSATNATAVVNSPEVISVKYYNQYMISLTYTVMYGPDPSGGPSASIMLFGSAASLPVNQTVGQVWADAGSTASLLAQLPGSNSGERWATNSTIAGTVAPGLSLNPSYANQFQVTLATSPQGIPVAMSATSDWYNSGTNLAITLIPGRGWNFESWIGSGTGSYSGTFPSLDLNVNAPITETANFYTALTITAPSTGSVSYSFGNVTGSVGTGQSKIVFVPPGQPLSMSASPFPVFYAFSSWIGNLTGGPNATVVNQNPYSFAVSGPASLAVSFKINIIGIIVVAVVVIVAVASVFMLRRRNRPEQEQYPEELSEEEGGTLETIEGNT